MHAYRLYFVIATVGVVLVGLTSTATARVTKIRAPRTYPYVISESGTYILDENLVVETLDTTGIEVLADNVTIDLNGFTIKGPVVCPTSTTCSPESSLGVGINAYNRNNVRVMNGTVRGMDAGVLLEGSMHRVEGMTVIGNSSIGIRLAMGNITNCIVALNGGRGIYTTFDHNPIRNCIVVDNADNGIESSGIVTASTAVGNVEAGILGELGLVSDSVANDNGNSGIDSNYSALLGNVVVDNVYGLDGSDSAYGFNYVSSNGPFSSIQVGGNVCGGDSICP